MCTFAEILTYCCAIQMKINLSSLTKSHYALWQTLPLLLLYALLLSLPCSLNIIVHGVSHFGKAKLFIGFLESTLPATIFWLISYKYKWSKWLISTVLWVLFIFEFFIFFQFSTRLTDRILFLVLQTDGREACEFFSLYLFTPASAKVLIISIILAAVYKLLDRYSKKRSIRRKHRTVFFVGLIVANIVSIAISVLLAYEKLPAKAMTYNTLHSLYLATGNLGSYRADVSRLEKTMKRCDSTIDESIYASDSIPDVIFIIGESYNPNHSPLYGYKLMTTPGLVRERNIGNLSVYSDVITPYSMTGKMMEVYYSPADAYAGGNRWDVPLVPSLYKHAGYVVTIHDNQCTRVIEGNPKFDVGHLQFLNSNIVEDASINYRNKDLLPYDLDFCRRELSVMQAFKDENKRPIFSIFHLQGQHFVAAQRYTEEFAHFTSKDYAWRKGLTAKQAEEIAAYDNATFYNDSVVCSVMHAVEHRDAVVVYVSDHGEEIHDYRNQYGRTMGPITRGIADNIYRVPLMIYTTPTFRERHASIAQQISASVNNKVFTGDIGQLLLYLGGLKTRWLDVTRVPILPNYSSSTRRILQDGVDYDTTYAVDAN